jgi:hypothetical protein
VSGDEGNQVKGGGNDGIIRFRLFLPSENGRPRDVPPAAEFYSCPLFWEGSDHGHDARIMLDGAGIERGRAYESPFVLLSLQDGPAVGTVVRLWEGRFVGDGVILERFEEPAA